MTRVSPEQASIVGPGKTPGATCQEQGHSRWTTAVFLLTVDEIYLFPYTIRAKVTCLNKPLEMLGFWLSIHMLRWVQLYPRPIDISIKAQWPIRSIVTVCRKKNRFDISSVVVGLSEVRQKYQKTYNQRRTENEVWPVSFSSRGGGH